MVVLIDKVQGTTTFVPVTEEEKKTLERMLALLQPNDLVEYGGTTKVSTCEGVFRIIFLHAGSHSERKEEKLSSHTTFITRELVGGVKLTLFGTSKEDWVNIKELREIL